MKLQLYCNRKEMEFSRAKIFLVENFKLFNMKTSETFNGSVKNTIQMSKLTKELTVYFSLGKVVINVI